MPFTFSYTVTLQDIDQVYDSGNLTAHSQSVDVKNAREFIFFYRLISDGTPETIRFVIEFQRPESTEDEAWYELDHGFFSRLEHEDTEVAGEGRRFCVTGPCVGPYMRVRVECDIPSGGDTFIVQDTFVSFKD